MAGGWSRDGAIQEQIDASVDEAISRARASMPKGASLVNCEACEEPIAEARRQALPGVRLCIRCQGEIDDQASQAGYNRRGSKDSQLR